MATLWTTSKIRDCYADVARDLLVYGFSLLQIPEAVTRNPVMRYDKYAATESMISSSKGEFYAVSSFVF